MAFIKFMLKDLRDNFEVIGSPLQSTQGTGPTRETSWRQREQTVSYRSLQSIVTRTDASNDLC